MSLLDHVHAGDERLHRRDLRPGAVRGPGRRPTPTPCELVNDNEYGNGAAIFTRDGGAARQFQFDVQAGMVGVNVPIPVPVAYYSFGGWKASLFGDTHMYGPDGVHFYTRTKVVTSRWPDPGDVHSRPRLPPHPLSSRTADAMMSDEAAVRADDRAHVFHSWSAQGLIDPMPVAGALGSYFWDYDGKRYLDFSLAAGQREHRPPAPAAGRGDPGAGRRCCARSRPAFANDKRGEAARLIAELAPGDLNMVFFTNGGAEANENAIRMARLHTGRHKVLADVPQLPRRHRRPRSPRPVTRAAGPTSRRAVGVVHFWGPYPYRSPFHADDEAEECERGAGSTCATRSCSRAPHTVAAILLETVVGTNGILVPPPGYLAGVRAICDEFGIVLIADEVMAGLRAVRRVVRGRPLGRHARPHHVREGRQLRLPAAGRGDHLRRDRRDVRERAVPGRADLLRAPARLRVGGRRRSRSSRRRASSSTPGRSARTSSARRCASWRQQPPERRRGARASACSGRSSWCATGRPASRWCRYNAAGAAAAPMDELAAACKRARAVAVHALQPGARRAARARSPRTRCARASPILDEALAVADRYVTE